MKTTKRTIRSQWTVTEAPRPGVPHHNHLPTLPAEVPGHVHLDLMREGVIPDPFARLFERDVSWVDDSDWIYETTFTATEGDDAGAYLRFHGLDTIAEIQLNGKPLGRTANMLVPHEFSVAGKLHCGEGDAGLNTLTITFRSARRIGMERQAAWEAAGNPTLPAHWDVWSHRSFVRKAQYMYGWDWGPELISCGVWQPVELITVPVARLRDWKHRVEFCDDGSALVHFDVAVERTPSSENQALWLGLRLDQIEASITVPAGPGIVTASTTMKVETPRLWNAASGEGDGPWLYDLRVDLRATDSPLETLEAQIGLRSIELIRERDDDGGGESFKFRVNGHDLFIKGANWIPQDSFPARLNKADRRIEDAIAAIRNAGFNMLRVWGGGLYESEEFYNLCDTHGILVWQDFAYGCAYYPDIDSYAEEARTEAIAAVRRIRNHPSLALWCGGNENDAMYYDGWSGNRPSRLLGENLYREILPAVVAAEDPATAYWPNSPFGGEKPNSPDEGDVHNWVVWHGKGDWVHYTENDARFVSEFGFAASCGLSAWDACLAPPDRTPLSPAVRWHDKTRKGYDTYMGYVELHYPKPVTLEDLVYYTQCNQADALKYGVEHYRRRKGRCWGTLIWQLNDCWPVQSWAMIDSAGEPKASFYASRRFYAPVLLSLVRAGDCVTAHLVNDRLRELRGKLTIRIERFTGEVLHEEAFDASVGENTAAEVAACSLAAAAGQERSVFLSARFDAHDGRDLAENLLFMAEPKDLLLPDPEIAMEVTAGEPCTVKLTARRFAGYVWLRRLDNRPLGRGLCEDNYFHLRAGESRTIEAPTAGGPVSAAELRNLLVVRTLYGPGS